MPNTPSSIGYGAAGIFFNTKVNAKQLDFGHSKSRHGMKPLG
jgi:pyrroline-5-carboxylate reductase